MIETGEFQRSSPLSRGTFADLSRGFFRVTRPDQDSSCWVTVAGYNLDRIRSYRAKKPAQEEAKPAQPKRRRGTWAETSSGRRVQ